MSIFISVFFTIAAMKFFEWFYNHYFCEKNDVSSIEKSPNNQPNNGQEEDMDPLQNRQIKRIPQFARYLRDKYLDESRYYIDFLANLTKPKFPLYSVKSFAR